MTSGNDRSRHSSSRAGRPLEDYALIGDTQTAALVSLGGTIDWLCLPRFDSSACFAALLGTEEHGCWQLAPAGEVRSSRRAYRDGTLVLDTELTTAEGRVRLTDFMPPRQAQPALVRVIEGLEGNVRMQMKLVVRFDFGRTMPWIRSSERGIAMIAGPDALTLTSGVPLDHDSEAVTAELDVAKGERVAFLLTWHPCHEVSPRLVNPLKALGETVDWWRDWSEQSTYDGQWRDAVQRSLVTLKALTFSPSGGIVAAPTTSLPECIGGVRNWDYRYCWVRDATFTLYALMLAGYTREAAEWRDWLLRAVAGHPSQLQILYSVTGERWIEERHMDWLPGYEGSQPVRAGNAACKQSQLDIYGEIMDAMHQARRHGLHPESDAWELQQALIESLESKWREPDHGIWEVRGPKRHFTHSKMMAWVAVDRAVRAVEELGLGGPAARWQPLREEMHREICREGFNAERGAFTQSYGCNRLDAGLLMMPLVGFLPPEDERVRGTVDAIERELVRDGFVMRYDPESSEDVDNLPPGEGAFVPCTFWLVDNLALQRRTAEARALFERLLDIRNDVGLLSEEYDPAAKRLVGNFPQAFSHVSLINAARNLSASGGPAEHRRGNCR